MATGTEAPDGDAPPVGQAAQSTCYDTLTDPGWSGPRGSRRPVLVVHGPQGSGKSHFLRHKARELEDYGVPYAHLDLASARYHSSVPDVFAAIASPEERGLARALKYYGRLRFPRLWTALVTIRLDIDPEEAPAEGALQTGTDGAHARIAELVNEVWPTGLGGLGRVLGGAGDLIPPAELIGVEPLPVDIAKWVAAVSGMGAHALERVFEWMRGQGHGAQPREQVTDSLYHLWCQARDPDAVDPVSRVSNREKVARFLADALFADLRNAARKITRQPTPVVLLDNADQGVGPVLLRSLAEVPVPYGRPSLLGGAGFPEPLTVVATSAGTVDGLPLESFYGDSARNMLFSPLSPLNPGNVEELVSRARARSGGGGHVSQEIADILLEFTGGHPGTTAQLAGAWVAVGGEGLHEALSHRPVDPATRMRSASTVEEHMLTTALGTAPDQLDHRLREALVTCSAARSVDAALWLNRAGDLTERVEEERLLAHPLWDPRNPEATTVLRRLLFRSLARRPTGSPGAWDAVHRRLADYYQSGEAGTGDSVEFEIYHRLCAGQLERVAWHLQGWLVSPDVDGREWVRRLRAVTSAPRRTRPSYPLLDSWAHTWRGAVPEGRTEDSEETETVAKLVTARQILADPDFFSSGALHSACHMALNHLAERVPTGANHLYDEAIWHLQMAARFGTAV
ncbi:MULTISPECIES: hypothetical protein [unclassified Nocardiopsis]|uniref:hypothetical protein n=1 Tax=unclassified Nocardiopsis TaxID=2649073 RepID=UPI00135C37FC|nr:MULTISPECIES: hypothetical protein [unclassified Nocardiopsis]